MRTALGWLLTLGFGAGAYLIIVWSGLAINTVATDSMEPTYAPTDIVFTLGPDRIETTVGEAIVFETEYLGTYIPPHMHRIIEHSSADDTFRTQGDNAVDPDGWVVQREGIKGVAVFSLPGWTLRNPLVLGGLIFLVVVIAVWPRKGDEDESAAAEGTADTASAPSVTRDPNLPTFPTAHWQQSNC